MNHKYKKSGYGATPSIKEYWDCQKSSGGAALSYRAGRRLAGFGEGEGDSGKGGDGTGDLLSCGLSVDWLPVEAAGVGDCSGCSAVRCVQCRHQVSVTAGTVLHKTHMPLQQWFLAFYLVCQDKRGISATQLASQLGTTYKTAWYMLKRIRAAMGQRDKKYQLSGVIEFDDAYFGGPGKGKKRGRGTGKRKVFVALSLDERGNPHYLKMQVTPNIRQDSVKNFAQAIFADDSTICSDGYRSYIPGLKAYRHKH